MENAKTYDRWHGLYMHVFSGTRCLTCWCLKAISGWRVIIGAIPWTGG